jgi:hypothetical protein
MSGERPWLYLYSRKNIAGSLLALLGVVAFLFGAIDHFWLAIVAGLYGVGYFAMPAPAGLLLERIDAGESPEAIRKSLQSLVARIQGKVEPDVGARVASIVSSINDTLPLLATGGGAQLDGALFTVRQMAVDYLPSALESYLKLPWVYRTRRALQDGKTAHDVLQEQLGLLDARMQEILVSVHENDMQKLLANGRFLKERFGGGGFALDPVRSS